MQLIKEGFSYDFMAKRPQAGVLSAALIVITLVAYVALGGLNYGIDFSGGTLVQVRLEEQPPIGELRQTLLDADVGPFTLQTFGDESVPEYLITLANVEEVHEAGETGAARRVEDSLREHFPNLDVRRVESVGPRVGQELKWAALQAVLLALGAILVYIWLRFQWRFGVGAIVALAHDVLIVVGAFVLTQKEITLPVVAAVLTVAGYSINDTIVVFDRIRENLRRYQKKPALEVFNESVNQTLSRTLLTSGTTLFVVLSIYLFGGAIINDFAFALLIGIVVGTYSSIFVAAPMVLLLRRWFPVKPTT